MKNKKEFELLNNLKYEIETEVTKDCVIKIRDTFLNTAQTQILDTREKEIIKAIEFLGWRKDKWEEESEENSFNFFQFDNLLCKMKNKMLKYLDNCKVKVSCKNGAILIERIEQC